MLASSRAGYGSLRTQADDVMMNLETLSDTPDAVDEDDDDDDEEDPGEFTEVPMVDLVFDGKIMVVKHRLENRLYTEMDLLSTHYDLSVLAAAACLGYNELVQLVLKHTNYRLLDQYASDPIVQAIENNHTRVVQTLLTTIGHEMDLPSIRNFECKPIAHVAAEKGFNEILEMLVAAGAPIDAVDEAVDESRGETALHYAARAGNARGVEILLDAHASINAVSADGKTALVVAATECDDDDDAKAVLDLLFMAEADVDWSDHDDALGRRAWLEAEVQFRATCPVHCMVRNGDEAKLVRWLRDANAAVMLAPHRWEGQYRQGAVWHPLGLTVNVVALPHEGCYRFFGSDADDVGPFTVIGEWTGDVIEATKVYEMQSVEYRGEIDVSSGVWRGDWMAGSSQDQFIMTLPLQRCPNCKENCVPNRDEPCFNCLPEGYNADVTFETIEEQRLRLEEIQERIATEILHTDELGRTAIMCAAAQGRSSILRVLLRFCRAQALECTDNDGKTALDHALSRKLVCKHNVEHKSNEATLECIELLVTSSKTPVDPSRIAATLTHTRQDGMACAGDCIATRREVSLSELAQQYEWDRLAMYLMTPVTPAILNKRDTEGKAVLHYIASAGKSDILAMLLDQPHLDLTLPTLDGEYALLLAARANRVKCVRMLLHAGADPLELITPEHVDYANFCKAPLGLLNDSSALYLLQAKHELKQQYPLYYLARVKDVAQASVHYAAQQSAVHVAIKAALPTSILADLIDQSIHDVNAQDKHDETPLMVATRLGLTDHVQVLLDNHADVDAVNNRRQSALMMAAKGGHIAIVAKLLEHLADVALRDSKDETVLEKLETYIATHLKAMPLEALMKHPHVKIRDAIKSEIRERQTSVEYRAKLAKSLSDVNVETAFRLNGFAKAINCSPALGVTFLNDCVSMNRHDVLFSHLDFVYGKHVIGSALHALLNMETDDPDLIFEAKTKCFEHVTIRRILEIKWELFGQRKFLEVLLMNLVLLVSMTISAVLFHDVDAAASLKTTSFEVLLGVLAVSLATVGYIAVQALRPRTFWRLARFHYDGSLEFEPELDIPDLERYKATAKRRLKLGVAIGTLLFAGLLIGILVVTSSISFFPVFNNVVLAGTAIYFVVNEYQEARNGLSVYLASTINVVQVSMYLLILVVFLPMQLNWFDTPDQIEIAVGSGITLTLWILSLQFLEVEENASYLLPMLTGLLKDLWNFFLFFGVFQIGITVTFFQLYKTTEDDGFNSLSGSFLTSYFVAFGQVPMDSMKSFTNDETKSIDGYDWILYVFAVGMIMAHSALVVFFLLNLLVANMNKTVDGGLEKAKTEALAAYAQCILRLEEAMHYSPQETQDLIYFIPPTPTDIGKLNPIFQYAMPKSHYGITAEVEAAIATHKAQQTSWLATANDVASQILGAFTAFENGFLDVDHFADSNATAVFANDLSEIAHARTRLENVFTSMRKSRGQQDRKELLSRFQKIATKDMADLAKKLNQLWLRSEGDHDRCVLVYELAHHATMTDSLHALQACVVDAFEVAKTTVDADVDDAATDRLAALETQLAEMQALVAASNAQVMAAMTAQFQTLLTAMTVNN